MQLLGGSPVFLTERATYQGSFGPGWGHSAAALMSKTWFHQGNHDYKEEDLPSFPSDPLDWQLEYRFPIPMTCMYQSVSLPSFTYMAKNLKTLAFVVTEHGFRASSHRGCSKFLDRD